MVASNEMLGINARFKGPPKAGGEDLMKNIAIFSFVLILSPVFLISVAIVGPIKKFILA